jgi:hypothetical protein
MPAPLVTAAPLLAASLVSAAAVVLPVAAMALAVLPAASLTLAVLPAAAGTNVAAAAVGTIEVRAAIVVGAFRVPLRAKPTAVRTFARVAVLGTELRVCRHDDAVVMLGVLKIALGRHQVAR